MGKVFRAFLDHPCSSMFDKVQYVAILKVVHQLIQLSHYTLGEVLLVWRKTLKCIKHWTADQVPNASWRGQGQEHPPSVQCTFFVLTVVIMNPCKEGTLLGRSACSTSWSTSQKPTWKNTQTPDTILLKPEKSIIACQRWLCRHQHHHRR